MGLLLAPVYPRFPAGAVCHKAVLLWSLLLPAEGSSMSVTVWSPHRNSASQNRLRIHNSRHNNWHFPTPKFLVFPAARSLLSEIISSLTNLVGLTLSSQCLQQCVYMIYRKQKLFYFIWNSGNIHVLLSVKQEIQ